MVSRGLPECLWGGFSVAEGHTHCLDWLERALRSAGATQSAALPKPKQGQSLCKRTVEEGEAV